MTHYFCFLRLSLITRAFVVTRMFTSLEFADSNWQVFMLGKRQTNNSTIINKHKNTDRKNNIIHNSNL